MPLTSRQLIRTELADLLATALDEVVAQVFAYPPLALKGMSPVVSVHNGGTTAQFYSADLNFLDHMFMVTIYVNREAHGDASESVLDEIYTAVTQAVRDSVTGNNYQELIVDTTQTSPAFAVIDGLPYRLEEISIMARSNPTG